MHLSTPHQTHTRYSALEHIRTGTRTLQLRRCCGMRPLLLRKLLLLQPEAKLMSFGATYARCHTQTIAVRTRQYAHEVCVCVCVLWLFLFTPSRSLSVHKLTHTGLVSYARTTQV